MNICFHIIQNPIRCQVLKLQCRNQNKLCDVEYSGKNDCIFQLSKETCLGEELGWDFVNKMESSHLSYTSFCNEQTRVYETNDNVSSARSAPFISCSTFVKWVFGWKSAMKTDFRKSVCPYCKYEPKYLAGDGTHVGVAMRNEDDSRNHLVDPDVNEVRVPIHKRFDRVLFKYNMKGRCDKKAKSNKEHLRYLCEKMLLDADDRPQFKYLSEKQEKERNADLLSHFHEPKDRPIFDVLEGFIEESTFSDALREKLAYLLFGLCKDAALVTFFPLAQMDKFKALLEKFASGTINFEDKQVMDNINPEVSNVLSLAVIEKCVGIFVKAFTYLCNMVIDLHSKDPPAATSDEILEPFNPETGVCYYLSEHGGQIRGAKKYDIVGSDNFDDKPDDGEECSKIYPSVLRGGYGYMYCWFCAMHGHSYGFHLIKGKEGRKDPFYSLYKYLKKAPKMIFYDFACSLSEYALNREAGYFSLVRFFQDLFHGVTHKCGYSFDFGRLSDLQFINSECCEQFNAYIQCIKYTATHLSQPHFIFLMQFFIQRWNVRKTTARLDRLNLTINCLEDTN